MSARGEDNSFDYIIVGAGSAGSVPARIIGGRGASWIVRP